MRRWFANALRRTSSATSPTIDDKIIRSRRAAPPVVSIGYENERCLQLRLRRARLLPRRTSRAPPGTSRDDGDDARIIARGHAYAADGNVYFDVRSYDDYSSLSNRSWTTPPALRRGERQRDPRDFAMWKSASRDRAGRPLGAVPGRAGTWSARRCPQVPVTPSTSTAAHRPIFPHTRTRSPSQGFRRRLRGVLGAQRLVTMSGREDEQVARNSVLVSDMTSAGGRSCCGTTLGTPHYAR